MGMSLLQEMASRYRAELTGSVIPFWMKHSIDRVHGGFWTCLDREGALYDPRKYVWMNGRQVWMLSRLYRTFQPQPEWLEAARLGAEFLRKNVFDEHGRCWFSLTADGRPSFYQRKPYGAAFVAAGFLEYSKASGDAAYRQLALDLIERILSWLADSTLLGRDPLPGAPRLSGLADIYILCLLVLDLLETDPHNTQYLGILKDCLQRIRVHYDPRRQLFYENAPLDAESANTPDGRLICPGSIFEVNWLLWRVLDRVPDDEVQAMLLETLEGGLEFGWDRTHGGFYYFLDLEGRPPAQLEWSMKLWWVHVEALYALLNAYVRTGDAKWLEWLRRVDEWVWSRFPDREFGEWYGYLDRTGVPAMAIKGGSYKGCFHIPRALLFSLETLRGLGFE
jgi:N-acylglucosamine 2-epimerase